MLQLTLHRCFALLVVVASLLLAMPGWAQDVTPARTDDELIAAWQASLDRAELAMSQNVTLDAAKVDAAKQSLVRVLREAQAMQSRVQERLAPLQAELASLGPAPDAAAPPEDAKVAETRARLQQELSAIQGRQSQTQLATVRAGNLLSEVSRLEQGRITAYMLTRGPTPLKPGVWVAASSEAVAAVESALAAPGVWWDKVVAQDLDETTAVAGISLLLFSVVLAWPLRRWIIHRWGAVAQKAEPSHTRRVIAAGTTGLADVLLPSIPLTAMIGVARLTAPSANDFFVAMVQGTALSLILFFFVAGLSEAVLSPRLPAWRIVPATTQGAQRLATKITLLAGIGAVANIAFIVASISGAPSAEFVAILMFLRNVVVSGLFLTLLRRENWLEPGVRPRSGFWPTVRLILAVIAISAPLLSLAGYAALSRFVFSTMVLSVALVGGALLLRAVLYEGLWMLLAPDRTQARTDDWAPDAAPVRPHRMTFWAGLMIDIVLWLPVTYLLLVFFGLSPALLNLWIGTALTGVRIGEVNLSLIDIAVAVFVAVFGLLFVGWCRRWLSERVMPNTRFDVGVQNSLTAGFSYAGATAVVMLAILALGVDLSSLALIAGALSVGIGFGLKTVAENFVAGILVLIERPIKVGDWIVVGGNEGIVKRISVRSTEIETFDHATVIVPNSDLIGQSVVNWTHKNRMVRVVITVGVAHGSDTRLVRDILIKCADKHPHVVADPAPGVSFRAVTDSSLVFELRTFVDDADYAGEVRNDLNFEIDDAFREHEIKIPFPQHELYLRTDTVAAVAKALRVDPPSEREELLPGREDLPNEIRQQPI